MAFTSDYLCNSFKRELMVATHNFTLTTGNVFKIALYTNTATFDASTTDYTVTNEITGTNYVAGGETLTNVTPTLDTGTAITDFSDAVWTTTTQTARGALIYNSTAGTATVCVLDFTADKTSTAGDFTVQFPAFAAATAIIRIA